MRSTLAPRVFALAVLLHASIAAAQQTPLIGHLESSDDCRLAHVSLNVDKGGVCVTTDSGGFVCAAPGQPGEEVRVLMPAHPKCLIFYPPDGRTTLKRPDSRESMTVTLVERDSPRWKSTDELRALLRNSGIRRDSQGLTPQQLDERLRTWMISIREATGRDDEAFTRLLVRKQGQIQEYSKVSELFHHFLNRGREVVAVFRQYAVEAPGMPAAAEYLISQIQLYNTMHQELAERGDGYQATVLTYWGKDQADGYQKLLEATLEVHEKVLLPVNEINLLINRLSHGKLKGEERKQTESELAQRTEDWAAAAEARLKGLTDRVDTFLRELKGTLADF